MLCILSDDARDHHQVIHMSLMCTCLQFQVPMEKIFQFFRLDAVAGLPSSDDYVQSDIN